MEISKWANDCEETWKLTLEEIRGLTKALEEARQEGSGSYVDDYYEYEFKLEV